MKFCPNCGAKNQGDARYCTHCGAAFPADTLFQSEFSSPDSAGTYSLPSVPPLQGENISDEVKCSVSDSENAERSVACFSSSENGKTPPQPQSLVPDERASIENSTPFTKRNLKELSEPQKRVALGCLILGGVFLLLYIVVGVFGWIPELFGSGTGIFILSLLFLFLGTMNFLIRQSVINNNKIITDSTYYVYRFYDEVFQVFLFDGTRKISETNLFYLMITRVEERRGQLRIYVGNALYCVDCSEFLKGSEAELKELLLRKSIPGTVKFKTTPKRA